MKLTHKLILDLRSSQFYFMPLAITENLEGHYPSLPLKLFQKRRTYWNPPFSPLSVVPSSSIVFPCLQWQIHLQTWKQSVMHTMESPDYYWLRNDKCSWATIGYQQLLSKVKPHSLQILSVNNYLRSSSTTEIIVHAVAQGIVGMNHDGSALAESLLVPKPVSQGSRHSPFPSRIKNYLTGSKYSSVQAKSLAKSYEDQNLTFIALSFNPNLH